MKSYVWILVLFLVCAAGISAVEAATLKDQVDAKRETAGGANNANANYDLQAVANPKKPQTLTGFPEGTLPGSPRGGSGNPEVKGPEGRVVFSGDPIEPVISDALAGMSLNDVCAIADKLGYSIVQQRYLGTSSLDSAYSFRVFQGRRRIGTLYFDRGLKLLSVR